MSDAVRCPACDAPLAAGSVDLRRGSAACEHCGVVSNLGGPAAPPPTDAAVDSPPPPAPRPEGWTVEERGGAVAVSWRWWSAKVLFLAVFAVGWNAFLIVWYGGLLGFAGFAGGAGPGLFAGGMALFGLPFVAVGVGLAYTALCGFVNRTTVTAGHDSVRVRHEPLPWRGSATHDAATFTRLFVREQVRRGENSTTVTHDLLAATADGGEVTLLRGLNEPHEARFLAKTVGRALGLP